MADVDPAIGMVADARPMTWLAGVSDGSAAALASPFVSIQTVPLRTTTRMIRWLKIARFGPLRRLTTSPTTSK